MKTIKVNIVTPDGPVVETEANMIIAATETGEIGILPGHIAMVAPLQIGGLRLKKDDSTEHVLFTAVSLKFVRMLSLFLHKVQNWLLLLISPVQKKRRNVAEETLQAKKEGREHDLAELDLKRAINRINVYETRNK